jgi:hypothetical protein
MPASLGVGGSSGLRREVAVFWGVRRNHKASSSGFHGSGLGWAEPVMRSKRPPGLRQPPLP